MTPVERNRAIKEIIDNVSIEQGDKDAHDAPLGVTGGISKEDTVISEMMDHVDGAGQNSIVEMED